MEVSAVFEVCEDGEEFDVIKQVEQETAFKAETRGILNGHMPVLDPEEVARAQRLEIAVQAVQRLSRGRRGRGRWPSNRSWLGLQKRVKTEF